MSEKLPEGWKIATLEDIARVTSGGTPSRKKSSYWNGCIPWVTTGEILFNTITQTNEYITELGMLNSSAKIFPEGTLLIAMYGQGKTRGSVARLGISAATNQACAVILLSDSQDSYFHFYNFQNKYNNIRNISNTSSQKNLSLELIKKQKIIFPPIFEQQKIAHILLTWDDAIHHTQNFLENSKTQKKALMQQLLTGRRRLPGFSEKWKPIKLSRLFERVKAKNSTGCTNVVTISAQHGLIRQEEFFNKTVASAVLDNYFLIKKGHFAYNKSYSKGYPFGAIKRLNRYDMGVVTSLYICFSIRDTAACDSDFFEHFFEYGALNSALEKIAHEGGRAHGLLNVKPEDFFSIQMTIPPLPEQKAIADVLTAADAVIQHYEAKLANLQAQKKALMQQLLTGKIRVKTDTDAAQHQPA